MNATQEQTKTLSESQQHVIDTLTEITRLHTEKPHHFTETGEWVDELSVPQRTIDSLVRVGLVVTWDKGGGTLVDLKSNRMVTG